MRGVIVQQKTGKTVNMSQGGAQIMRYRIGEGLELFVTRFQFGGAVFSPLLQLFIQLPEFLLDALALDGVQNGPGQLISVYAHLGDQVLRTFLDKLES